MIDGSVVAEDPEQEPTVHHDDDELDEADTMAAAPDTSTILFSRDLQGTQVFTAGSLLSATPAAAAHTHAHAPPPLVVQQPDMG